MSKEIVDILRPKDGQVFIDMTFGGGGHTKSLLETNKAIKVIAVDRDPVAFDRAQKLASEVAVRSERLGIKQSVIPIHGKFSSVSRNIHLNGIPYHSVNGIIFDLGASSLQFDNPERGFSLSLNGPLDMRMDTMNESDITAEDVVNNMSQYNLANIIKTLGEERRSRKVSNAIVDARTLLGRIRTTRELARIIESASPPGLDSIGRFTHPGTKTFQALRIFVNNELNELNYALDKMREFLIPANGDAIDGAGLALVLTFHSLEDRIVKRHFTGIDPDEPIIKHLSQHDRIRTNAPTSKKEVDEFSKGGKWKPILKHVMKPSEDEVIINPRSRSAKLRAAARIA